MRTRPPRLKESVSTTVSDKQIHVLVVDGNAVLKRGYIGAKSEINRNGESIGGIYQFLTLLRKRLIDGFYQQVYVFWDGKLSGKLRYNLYTDYKIDRGKDYINGNEPDEDFMTQKNQVCNYLEELAIRQYQDDIIEGDDCVAYFCNRNDGKYKVTIMTNDRDMAQLVDDNTSIYLIDLKKEITRETYASLFEVHPDNTLLVKVILGDSSDSIKGIKGLGKKTLLTNFPEFKTEPVTLDWFIEKAQFLQDERISNKKKPLQVYTNIIERITIGIQGKEVYEVNKLIMDLKNPLLTEQSIINLESIIEAPMDYEGRSLKNVQLLMRENRITDIIRDNMDDYLHPFKKLIQRDKKIIKN